MRPCKTSTSIFMLSFLFLMMLFLPSSLYGYGKTHAYITIEALNTWPGRGQNCKNPEYFQYLQPFGDRYYKLIDHDPTDTDEYSGGTILEGDVEEDGGIRSLRIDVLNVSLKEWVDHFWDPIANWTVYNDDPFLLSFYATVGFGQPFHIYSMTAFEKAAFMFTLAYIRYREGNRSLGYYYLGRTAHLMQDMAVPAHANQDIHLPYINADGYENWTRDNINTSGSIITPVINKLDLINFNNELINVGSLELDQGRLIDFFDSLDIKLKNFADIWYVYSNTEAIYNLINMQDLLFEIKLKLGTNEIYKKELSFFLKKLKILFYNLARAAQYFPSDDSDIIDKAENDDGNPNDGRLHSNQPYPPFTSGWPIIDQNWLWLDNNKYAIASCLIPRAIQFTAALYELFHYAAKGTQQPTITDSLTISPTQTSYSQNQTILAQFTITNKGIEPITLKVLTVGGRDPDGLVADFTFKTNIILQPNVPYLYNGSLTLTKIGPYHFFTTYQNQDVSWNTSIPTDPEKTNIKDINVVSAPQPPAGDYNNAAFVAHVSIPDGTLMSPGQIFKKTWGLRNSGSTTWNSSYKLSFVSQIGSYQMGGPSSVSVPGNITPGNTVDISVNLVAPASEGTYYGYWKMKDPSGNWFGDKIWVKIVVITSTPTFNVGDWVRVAGTGGIGLKVRNCPSTNDTNCPKKCTASDGSTGRIVGGPQTDDGYTLWEISWDNGSGNCPNGTSGWSAQNWFERVSYPSEGELVKAKGIIFVYLIKNGKKWWIKNEDIFNKMGYSWSNIREYPESMINNILNGPTIVDNGSLIKQQGDPKVYLIQNNQRRWITSEEAFITNGYRWEDIVEVTSSILTMYPQGTDITLKPNVWIASPNGGEKFIAGNQYSIVWSAKDDVGVNSINLFYSVDNGTSWNLIASGLSNSGYYPWTPNFTSSTVKVKVVAYDTSGISGEDMSDGNFSIEDIYRYVDLTITSLILNTSQASPGQQVTVTTTVFNQGNGASTSTNVKYYFSTSSTSKDSYLGQSNVLSVGAGSSTTLTPAVTIPTISALQGYIVAVVNPDYLVQESTTGNNTAVSLISIIDNEPPVIKYLAFGWGYYKTGYEYPIVFDVTDNNVVKSLGFYYSVDNQATWNTITSYFIPGSNGCSNCYRWTIPASLSLPSTLWVKLVARDASGNTAEKIIGPYQIKDGSKPLITVLSPNGGEIWDLGTTQTIKWSVNAPNGIARMRLYLNWAGQTWFIDDITNNISGSYVWNVPNSSFYVTNTARIRIYVEDKNANENEDWSDSYFVIRDSSTPPPPPWTTPHVITSVPSTNWPYTSKDDSNPKIATDSTGNVHLIYKYIQDDLSGIVNNTGPRVIKQEILYKKLSGVTWSEPVTVYSVTQQTDSNLTGYYNLEDLQISVDSHGYPHVVWMTSYSGPITNRNQNDIFYIYYNGSTWATPINLSNDIPGFPTLTTLTWSSKTNLPEAKRGAASAVVNDKLYVFGGSYRLSNYEYDPTTNTWTRKADLPGNGIDEGGAAVINGKIYAVGDPFDNNVKIYDPSNNTWTTGASIPTPRRGLAVASVNGKLYAIGGWTSNKNEMYDPQTNTWTTKANLPTPRGFAGVAVVDNKIYIIGGRGSEIYNMVEVYDPTTDSWSIETSMPTPRSGVLASIVNEKIYVVGGFNGYSVLNTVEEYDITNNSWLSKTSMSTARMDAAGGAVGSNIYVVGGYDYTNNLAVSEQASVSGGGSATVSEMPQIAMDPSDNLHVVWLDGYSWNSDYTITGGANIYYRRKSATGIWSPVSQVTSTGAGWPSITSDSYGNLHMVYLRQPNIAYLKWDGAAWSSPTIAATSADGLIDIARDQNNNLYMVWYYYESTSNRQQILYSYYDDISWSAPEIISDIFEGQPFRPSIVVDSLNRPHVIFEESGSKNRVIYRYKDINGWSAPVQLNLVTQGVSEYSTDMAISANDIIFVVWVSAYGGYPEVFYNFANVSGAVNDITSPSVSVISPSVGSSLSIGATYNITWTASDNISVTSVTLEYTPDGGSTYTLIPTNGANDGIYQWTVPNLTSNNVQIRVTAQDAAGNKGVGLSGIFSIGDLSPPFVVLAAPNGGETFEAGSQQKIQWTASDNVGISKTDLFYSIDNGITWNTIVSGISGTEYLWTVPSDAASNCRVKVVVFDSAGNVGQDISDGDFGIVSANKPPFTPNNPSPADGTSGVPVGSTFSWTGGDPDTGDTVTYDVYFGKSGNIALVSSGQSGNSFNPGNLNYGQVYYWQIVATDNHGNTSTGPVWSYVTKSQIFPAIGVSPGNLSFQSILGGSVNAQSLDIWNAGEGTLNWSANSNSSFLKLSSTSGTNSGIVTASVNTTGVPSGTYNATVTISDPAATNSPASIPVTLVINQPICPTPGVPSSPSPLDGTTGISTSPTLSWTSSNADFYDVYFGTSSNPPLVGNTGSASYPRSGLSSNTTYYWKIVAKDNCGNSTPGLVWSFTTGSAPDTTPPTPNPMTWATQPYAASSTSISMVATTATDGVSPPVSYYFDFMDSPTGGTGGSDSNWQSFTSYTNSGLQANHRYGYQVKARDSASTPNETSYSSTVYKYTLANAPGPASFSNVTLTSIRANWTANGNRSGTEYFCENTTAGTNSGGWTTNLYWDSSGLACGTSYSFRVKARNGDGIETAWTSLGSQSTLVCDTTAPSPPKNLRIIGTGPLRIAWDPPTTRTDGSPMTNLAGHKVYLGTFSGSYGQSIDVGNVTTYTLIGLTPGQTYYIVVTAYDTSNKESGFSNEVSGVNPSSVAYKWVKLQDMNYTRGGFSYTLLQDGSVLIAGGQSQWYMYDDRYTVAQAEIYDPKTQKFLVTGSLNQPRLNHGAVLTGDGKVLIAGGSGGSIFPEYKSVEIYDPATGEFSLIGNMSTNRIYVPTLTLLPSGKVLIAGGAYEGWYAAATNSVDEYDPISGNIALNVGNMLVGRFYHKAAIVSDSTILYIGGASRWNTNSTPVAELYDFSINQSTVTSGQPSSGGGYYAMVVLPNGKVLVKKEDNAYPEYYDPNTGKFELITCCGTLAGEPLLLENGNILFIDNPIKIFDPETGKIEKLIEWPLDFYMDGQIRGIVLNDGSILFTNGSTAKAFLLVFGNVAAAPTNLTATPASQTQINLSWLDNSSDESDFHIERSPNGSTGWTQIGIVSANTTSYSNTGLTCGTSYYYRVWAHRHSDEQYSGYSNTANASTQTCPIGVLSVTPFDELSSSGNEGGPFSPSSKTYTLQNTGGSSISWTASKGQAWVSLSGTSGTLAAGASTTISVSINSSANSLTPGSYSDTVSFTNMTNGNGNTSRSVSLTINPAPPGALQFSSATYSVNENGGSALITVTRTGGSNGVVGVSYATSNGTATAGSDYTSTSGTLSWANGDTSNKTFSIPILDDSAYEGNETVNLTLSSATGGATLGSQNAAVLTIIDVPPILPGVLQFSSATYSVNENGGSALITVTRTGGSSGAVGVSYATSNGTATAGSDYTATSGPLTWANGDTASKTFSVPILTDSVSEPNETVNLTLSSPTGGATLGSPSTAVLTIIENPDQNIYQLSCSDGGIQCVERVDGNIDSNNLVNGKPKVDVEYEFMVIVKDTGGVTPQYVRLFMTQRNNPGAADFYDYDTSCTGSYSTGATCTYRTMLGPAAVHKFYFEAKMSNGTTERKPDQGYITGPEIQLLTGYNLVGIPRDIKNASLDGSTAFGSTRTYGWDAKGYYTKVTNADPVMAGEGYFVYKAANTLLEHGTYNDIQDSEYSYQLIPGWNIISNPYAGNVKLSDIKVKKGNNQPLSWAEAITSGWLVNAIYSYNGSDWGKTYKFETSDDGAELVPWMGYWIYLNKTDDTYSLVFPKPAK